MTSTRQRRRLVSPHLVMACCPMMDVIYCRETGQFLGDIIEARWLIPREWAWELANMAAIRAKEMRGRDEN